MVSISEKSYSKRLLHLISWSHWFTFFNIIAAIILASVYLAAEPMPETVLGRTYMVLTWFSHMAFLVFVGFLLTIFPLTILLPKTRFIRGVASVVFSIALFLLLLDGYVYSQLGYHLNASSSEQIFNVIFNHYQKKQLNFVLICGLIFSAILAFELVVSNYAWKHLKQLQKTALGKVAVVTLVFCFFASHVMHIAADVELNYDVLRQDTLFPLSYPSTAKTLLTKYGFIDKSDYIERKNKPLKIDHQLLKYPQLTEECVLNKDELSSIKLVLTDRAMTLKQQKQFRQRASGGVYRFNRHVDSAAGENAFFNLFFGLPSIYQDKIIADRNTPVLFQLLDNNNLDSQLFFISDDENMALPLWLTALFNNSQKYNAITPLLTSFEHSSVGAYLEVYYLANSSDYQFELLVDSILLSQREKTRKDIIWIGSVGNLNSNDAFGTKPGLLIIPNGTSKAQDYATNNMDIHATLVQEALHCLMPTAHYTTGNNLTDIDKNRTLANTTANGIMVFNKDKSVFVDQNGNFQSYSTQLNTPITEKSNYPLLIDAVNYLKQFEKSAQID